MKSGHFTFAFTFYNFDAVIEKKGNSKELIKCTQGDSFICVCNSKDYNINWKKNAWKVLNKYVYTGNVCYFSTNKV